jgi:hypothetical protein
MARVYTHCGHGVDRDGSSARGAQEADAMTARTTTNNKGYEQSYERGRRAGKAGA